MVILLYKREEKELENLLSLDGTHFIINETLQMWVKFSVIKVQPTIYRPWGIRYSLTLHNKKGERLMGFDNAHQVEALGNKKSLQPTFYHWHRTQHDAGRPYHYVNAIKLLEDFWREVDKQINLWEATHETS